MVTSGWVNWNTGETCDEVGFNECGQVEAKVNDDGTVFVETFNSVAEAREWFSVANGWHNTNGKEWEN